MPFRASFGVGPADAVRVACWEDEAVVPFRDIIAARDSAQPLVVWVGPEGGISMEEAVALRAIGATTVTLGPRILRSETAAIIAVAQGVGDGWV